MSKSNSNSNSKSKYTLPTSIRQILSNPPPAKLNGFDPWNSVSTGHQRAEGRSISQSAGWRRIRNRQITGQFGRGGIFDAGAGSGSGGGSEVGWKVEGGEGARKRRKVDLDLDLELELGEGKRRNGDIRAFMGGVRKGNGDVSACDGGGGGGGLKRTKVLEGDDEDEGRVRRIQSERETRSVPELIVQKGGGALCFENNDHNHDNDDHGYDDDCTADAIRMLVEREGDTNTNTNTNIRKPAPTNINNNNDDNDNDNDTPNPTTKQIFANLSIYINGSTMPVISDHRLKHLLASHGANISSNLARRSITHVILGCPNGNQPAKGINSGAGGGLAAGKLQREIHRVGGKGVKFVGVEWVLESIKAGRRLPETRFADLHMASGKQRSVFGDFYVKAAAS